MSAEVEQAPFERGPVVGIDLGGTKMLAGLVETTGLVRSRVLRPSSDLKDQPEVLLDRLAEAANEAAEMAGIPLKDVAGIGLVVPGPLNRARDTVTVAPNLGWTNLAARDALRARLGGVKVFLENDVRGAALAEHALGAGRRVRSMLAVFVGTGVGGGLIVNGRLYHGTHGGAGEIGHVVVRAGGPRCSCGRRGCLEALAARAAIAGYVAQAAERGRETVLVEMLHGHFETLTSRDLAQAVEQNDQVALNAARKSARYVGTAIGSVANLLDPALVVLGGGFVEAVGERYVRWVTRAAHAQILSESARGLPIVLSALGDDAGLMGAALTAIAGLEDEENGADD